MNSIDPCWTKTGKRFHFKIGGLSSQTLEIAVYCLRAHFKLVLNETD